MAIHHLTPPIRGGERPRLPSTQIGPVTQAIRAMRADNPDLDRERIDELRRQIAERIEADIALLDALDGDCDLEEDDPAGGDINDEPHDAEEDAGADADEPPAFLCTFDGTNYVRADRRRQA